VLVPLAGPDAERVTGAVEIRQHGRVETYARHNGHADLVRESVDGETGE
jgi:Protein of unknown function (DUF664)